MRKLIFLLLIPLVTTLSAQETIPDTAAIRKQFVLDEVEVVSSSPVFSNQSNELHAADLQQDNIGQNLPYLLSSAPALIATSDDGLGIGYTYLHIRGTDYTRINMTINDIPLNDPESQTVFWVNLTDMGSSVNSLRVQRGVGSSKNGSSAFGASINLLSLMDEKALSDRPVTAELQFTGGMYKTFREMLTISARFGNWHMGGRISKVNSDGYIERASSDLISYQTELGWTSPVGANGKQTAVTLLSFGGSEKTYMAWYGIDAETMAYNRRFNPAGLTTYTTEDGQEALIAYPDQTDNYRQHHVQLHIRHRFNLPWSLKATAHYTYGRGYYQMADYGGFNPLTGWAGITQDGLTNHLGGAHIQAQYLHERWSTQFGFSGQYYTCDHWGTLDQMPSYLGLGQKTDANLYARFSEYLLHRGQERLMLYEDLQYRLVDYRIDKTSEYTYEPFYFHKTYHFLNPKLGLEYRNNGHELTASFAMANREPTRSNFLEADMYKTSMPASERLYDYELGYNYHFYPSAASRNIHGSVGVNLYFMDYDNQLVATGDISRLSYPTLTNVKTSYRTGVELQYTLHWTKWLRWEGNLVFSRNRWKLTDGTWNTISFSPDWTAYNALDFHIAGFTGIISNQIVSSQYLTNAQNDAAKLKAYTVTNLHLSYLLPIRNPKAPKITLRCLINNLFNTEYCSNGGAAGDYVWYFPQATINVHAGFCVRW